MRGRGERGVVRCGGQEGYYAWAWMWMWMWALWHMHAYMRTRRYERIAAHLSLRLWAVSFVQGRRRIKFSGSEFEWR